MKVVVTGAAGFIGSHLVDALLEAGCDVVGIDAFVPYYPRAIKEHNLEAARRSEHFRLIEGHLQELELRPLLEGAEQIYHLAAQAGVRASWGTQFELYSNNNVLGTQRLLEAAVAAGKPRVIYASSSSVYGATPALPLRETSPCRPVSPYGVTKLAAEHLLALYEHNHALPAVSLRYFTVYGPRQRPDMAFHRFLRAARDGGRISLYGDGQQTRDFTYITDIVAATRAAAVHGQPGDVYNIGGGQRVALSEVLQLIERVTRTHLTIDHEPAQRGDMRDTFADTTAAERDLNFRSAVSLSDGLAEEWNWLREAV